jgi:hypothetical protein
MRAQNACVLPRVFPRLSPKVKIGLTASNLSKKPSTTRFCDFFLVDDKLKLAEEFGD